MARARRRRRTAEAEAPAVVPNIEVEQPGGAGIDMDDVVKFINSVSVDQLSGLHSVLSDRLAGLGKKSRKEAGKPRPRTGSFAGLVRYVRTAVDGEVGNLETLDAAICDRLDKAGF